MNRKLLVALLALLSAACVTTAVACGEKKDGKTPEDDETLTDQDKEEDSDPWDDYNTIDWEEKYDVPSSAEGAFHGYTSVTTGGVTNWQGLIKFNANRGAHDYQAEDAIWQGDVVKENGFVTYIESGEAAYFIFESDYTGDVLITLGVATAPETQTNNNGTPDDPSDDFEEDVKPEDKLGRPAERYMSVKSGVLPEDAGAEDINAAMTAATTTVDISDCWITGTRDWLRSAANNVGETTITAGRRNVIAIYSYGDFNLDYMIITPAKETREAALPEIKYTGETLRVEAEDINDKMVDCRIEYNDARSGDGDIGFTTSRTSLTMRITVDKDCYVRLSVNAAFGPGSNLLEDRLMFTCNRRFIQLYESNSRYPVYDEEKDHVRVGADGSWYYDYNTYTLPPYATLQLKAGENTIVVNSGNDANFNIDYFEFSPAAEYNNGELKLEAESGQIGVGSIWANDATGGATVVSGTQSVSFVVYSATATTVDLSATYICGSTHNGFTEEQYNTLMKAAQYISVNGERNYEAGFDINSDENWATFGTASLGEIQLEAGLNIITVGIDRNVLAEGEVQNSESQDMGIFLDYLTLLPVSQKG